MKTPVKPVPEKSFVPNTPKVKDAEIADTHSQDADRHRGVKHPVSEK